MKTFFEGLFIFLIVLFCTPAGWIGMLAFALVISIIRGI
jgi:hypothetical protein